MTKVWRRAVVFLWHNATSSHMLKQLGQWAGRGWVERRKGAKNFWISPMNAKNVQLRNLAMIEDSN